MSIIAQARLLYLSHRCLSFASRHREICDKPLVQDISCPVIKSPLPAISNRSSWNGIPEVSPMGSVNTPNWFCFTTQILNQKTYSNLSIPTWYTSIPFARNHISYDKQIHWLDPLHNHAERSDLCKVGPYNGIQQQVFNTYIDNDFFTTDLVKASSQSHNKRYGQRGRSRFGRRIRSSMRRTLMFAILGLFNGISQNDIDEQKAKLSDTEKLKQMTEAEILIAKAVLAMCDKDHLMASGYLHQALKLAIVEDNEPQEVLILNVLACNCFEGGDLQAAEKLFIDLIKRMITNNVDPTDPAILELSLKLASIYCEDQTTHDKATKGFNFVINSLVSHLSETLASLDDEKLISNLSDDTRNELALLGWAYDWYAKHMMSLNNYEMAAKMLKSALQISERILGPTHEQTLVLLNDVGTTLATNDAPEEAQFYIQKAVAGAIRNESKELAAFYANLGLVNMRLNKLDDARKYCEQSLEIGSRDRRHYNYHNIMRISRGCLKDVEELIGTDK